MVNIAKLLREHDSDPAVKVVILLEPFSLHLEPIYVSQHFIPKLRDHLLARLHGHEYDGDECHFSDAEQDDLVLENLDHVPSPKRLQVYYTTYDVRRDRDSLTTCGNGAVMTLSREEGNGAHLFWYARVLHAFQVPFRFVGPHSRVESPHLMEVLWVRWFGVEPGYQWGFKNARLPKVGFVPDTDESAFGFLDPGLVIRACHLIPAFAAGRTTDLMRPGTSLGRLPGEVDDWVSFYVNMCVVCPELVYGYFNDTS